MDRLYEYFKTHRWTATLLIIGVIVFVLLITINFWRTLLLVVILFVCWFFGNLLDKGGVDMIKSFFDRILPK